MYKTHPAAAVMPALTDQLYQEMVASIKADGLIYPIKLIDDLIIDGNHRQQACLDAGVEPRYEQIETDDPVRYVMSCDTRRHLTTKQRSHIAAELANMDLGQNQHTKEGTQNCVSQKDAADLMGVSQRSVSTATKVMKDDPEAHEAAKRGEKVKAKPKEKKQQRVSWRSVATERGILCANPSASQCRLAKEQICSVDKSIKFPAGGMLPDAANQLMTACDELILRQDPKAAKVKAEYEIERIDPLLSASAGKKLDAAIRSHKRAINADFEWRLQQRIKEEISPILSDYSKHHQKHIDIINAYQGVMTNSEYKLIAGLLHSDGLPGIDDVKRARFDKGFNIFKQKRELLCGIKESEKLANTLPTTLEELLKMKRAK